MTKDEARRIAAELPDLLGRRNTDRPGRRPRRGLMSAEARVYLLLALGGITINPGHLF
jgi:hypothetical protein